MSDLTATEKALLALGKTQVDVMFSRQEDGPVIDDSEFLPMLEVWRPTRLLLGASPYAA